LDPELRGLVLSEFLHSEKVFGEGVWDSTPQEENLQETFFWMHPKVRLTVLEDWVKAANNHDMRNLLPSTNEELVSVTFR
jgi:hypothetical protein